MSAEWKYVTDGVVLDFFAQPALSRSARRRLQEAFRRIVNNPSQTADLIGYDATGRPLSVVNVDEFEIVYWVDHLAKEVRVVSVFRD